MKRIFLVGILLFSAGALSAYFTQPKPTGKVITATINIKQVPQTAGVK